MEEYRTGIDRIINLEDDYDLFGAKTVFRALTSSFVEKIVSQGKWFSFCKRISEKQVDIMSQKNKDGIKMGSFVSEFYPETLYRSAIYKYLLRDYMCYYEAPMVMKDYESGYKHSYNKFLATSNLEVIARWLDISLDEADMLYGSRIEESCEDNGCDMFPYVKLYETKEGVRKVSRPRKDLDLGIVGTRVIPVYALKVGVDILYRACSKDFYNVEFVKDGGQERTVNITFDIGKLRNIYGDSDFLRSNIEMVYDGYFDKNPYLERGYIRVFEAGSSKYDSPLRAINYARILGFKKAEPDLTYINIDINNAMTVFLSCINDARLNVQDVVEMLDIFNVGTERSISGRPLLTPQDLESWANAQLILLSTVFLRQLSLFMIGNSQWFNGYTGGAVSEEIYESDGEEIDNFEFDMIM